MRRRDPLRLLIERLLAGYAWYLPLLRWWTQRLGVRRELAADRAATATAGVAAVAGALLKLADYRRPALVVAINPIGDLPERIAHLEGRAASRRTRTAWWLAGASLTNLIALSAAAMCCTGLGIAMAGGMT